MTASVLLQLLAVVVLPAGALSLLCWAILGRRWATRPRCRACLAPLSSAIAIAREPCPRCRADLSAEHAMRPVWSRSSGRFWVLAILVVVGTAILAPSIMNRQQGQMIQGPISDATLTESVLTTGFSRNDARNTLLRRREQGELDFKAVRTQFLGPPATSVAPARASPPRQPAGISTVSALLLHRDPRDTEVADAAIAALIEPVTLSIRPEDGSVVLATGPGTGGELNNDLCVVVVLRTLEVDGVAVDIGAGVRGFGVPGPEGGRMISPQAGSAFAGPEIGRLLNDASKGTTHRAEAKVEVFVYDHADGVRLRDERMQWLPRQDWPTPLRTKIYSLTAPAPSSP